ncbi:MAG TPA: hypothetical protein VFC00_27435 [Micromonosporaceae bacterium]|nr:hypothetical protein [Micromonosporaceae bacterium]
MGWLGRWLGRGRRSPDSWAAIRPRLLPVLRGVTMPVGHPSMKPPLRRSAMPFLAEMVVIDQPSSMIYLGSDRPRNWGVPPEEVFAVARRNLAARLRPPDGPPPEGPVMLRFVDDGDAYWTSCLLLDGWLAGLADRVDGRPVAFVPDRSSLIVVADRSQALESLFEMVESDYLREPRAISPMAYVSDDNGRTVPYDAPPGHPLHHRVRRAERILGAREYAHQRAMLSGRYAGAELAELSLMTPADGSVFTMAVWPRARSVLLPRADFVSFESDFGDPPFVVPWPEAVEHALLRPTGGVEPARYRVDDWPAEPALGTLRGLSFPSI